MARATRQANHASPLGEWGLHVGAAYAQTWVLEKGRAKDSAEIIEEPRRELGLVGARPPPKAEARRGAGTATQAN